MLNIIFPILSLAFTKGKIPSKAYTFKEEKYTGINQELVPMRIYYSSKYTHKTAILFLGASPDGEKHKALNCLAKMLTKFGYNVFMPRIPPLMNLDISNQNVDWMRYLYKMISSRADVNNKYITAIGISYGGGMLLKASLSKEMLEHPPKSIFLYGAGCNANTILNFITKGLFTYQDKEIKIDPHEWGLTVFFHHFIDDIEFGFDKKNIKEVIQLRIKNEKEKAANMLKQLNDSEYHITNSIISGKINNDVQAIVDNIIAKKSSYIESLSCKPICSQVLSKVFIFHGANDNMIPFTESIQLKELLPNANLIISYLFGHKGISGKQSLLFKFKEVMKLLRFFSKFDKYNAS